MEKKHLSDCLSILESEKMLFFRFLPIIFRYLVIVFHHGGSGTQEFIQAFSDQQAKLGSAGTEVVVVCCTQDRWVCTVSCSHCRTDDCFRGLSIVSDRSGRLARHFGLYDREMGRGLDGVVVVDDEGIIRHVMTTALEFADAARNTLEIVNMLKDCKVDVKDAIDIAENNSDSIRNDSKLVVPGTVISLLEHS